MNTRHYFSLIKKKFHFQPAFYASIKLIPFFKHSTMRTLYFLCGFSYFLFHFRTKLSHKLLSLEENPKTANRIKPTQEFMLKGDKAYVVQHNANDPIEDRYCVVELKNIKGYFLSVLDGHGGHELADYANKRLYKYFDQIYKELPTQLSEDERIIKSLTKAFQQIEQEYLEIATNLYQAGDGISSTAGSCVIVAVVTKNKIYIAQLGDSKAKLFSRGQNEGYNAKKLTSTHNSRKLSEQERLAKEFPDEEDIVVCRKHERKVCYVKGRLQPTRSLGDFHLKFKEFNEPSNVFGKYKKLLPRFSGPYIKSDPEIQAFDIRDEDEYIVLATDGLWDFLSSQQVAEVIGNVENKSPERKKMTKEIAETLFSLVMNRACNESHIQLDTLMTMSAGRLKRQIHDDITLIVFDLKRRH